MSTIHPLAIANAASITSLVRITLYHHSISVYHAKVEMNEGVAALGENETRTERNVSRGHLGFAHAGRSGSRGATA